MAAISPPDLLMVTTATPVEVVVRALLPLAMGSVCMGTKISEPVYNLRGWLSGGLSRVNNARSSRHVRMGTI